MPREDSLSSRFDYLFEPLDVAESMNGADKVEASAGGAADEGRSGSAAPVRMAFAAFVLATLGAVAAVAVLLLQQPNRSQVPSDRPIEPSPLPTTVANIPSEAAAVAPPSTTADTPTPRTVEFVPTEQVVPAPQQPTPTPRTPQSGVTTPGTRAPISVAPESRPPFPNQGPRAGENGGDGLLGGLL
jgi:hypothetical protein